MSVLETRHLEIGYGRDEQKRKCVARNLTLTLEEASLVCLLGPNGSGKSTLLRTLAGIQRPLDGELLLGGKFIEKISGNELARICSVVLTDTVDHSLTGYAVVAIGRYPYTGWMGKLRKQDEERIQWAITATATDSYIHRPLYKMSDGERQKVMIARALAQDTPIVLLDEPTAHLDLPNRVDIIRLLRTLAHETRKAILLSTHDLELAIQAADQIWLMHPEQPVQTGCPEDLILQGAIQRVFPSDGFSFDASSGGFLLHTEKTDKIALSGKGLAYLWTKRALERNGFEVVAAREYSNREMEIEVNSERWLLRTKNSQEEHATLESLLKFLKR